eukprot:GHVQ01025472.1.p1 GENE.GHVQ01025472.1~~GHVQ01025472.1.p1  ORF type:complete len:212 (+),score=15.25 GHVQ01025472.1:710-1345(+)
MVAWGHGDSHCCDLSNSVGLVGSGFRRCRRCRWYNGSYLLIMRDRRGLLSRTLRFRWIAFERCFQKTLLHSFILLCPNTSHVFVSCSSVVQSIHATHFQVLSASAVIGVASAVAVGLALPLRLSVLGFGAAGVSAGTMAAAVHSAIGNVASGSMFAAFQSWGAAGVPAAWSVVSVAAGSAGWLVKDLLTTREEPEMESYNISKWLFTNRWV